MTGFSSTPSPSVRYSIPSSSTSTKDTYLNELKSNLDKSAILRSFTEDDLQGLKSYTYISSSDIINYYLTNKDYEPKYVLELKEGDKKYLRALSAKIIGSKHQYVVGYCNVGGKLKLRIFRRSVSEGARRAGLGKDFCGVISKGQSIPSANYEMTTKVDYLISKKLNEIDITIPKKNGLDNNDPIDGFSANTKRRIFRSLTKEMEESIEIDKFFEDYPASSSNRFFNNQDIKTVKEGYKQLGVKNLDLSKLKIVGGYYYNHDYLGAVKVDICSAEWNGKPINIHFARAIGNRPDKVRVENVEYTNAKIDSFGTRGRQINTAPLTVKPIEYESQCPKDMAKGHQTFGSYVDIRDLYQETPIIAAYKKKFLNA